MTIDDVLKHISQKRALTLQTANGSETNSTKIIHNTVTYGRAIVRIIEAANLLLSRDPVWTERLLLRLVRKLYTHRLRDLVAALPADITAEILAASEQALGPARGFSNN